MQHGLVPPEVSVLREVTATLGAAVTSGGAVQIELSGRLHAGCLLDVRLPLLHAVSTATGSLCLDLSRAELGDAAAVGLLVEAHYLALRRGRRLVVTAATPRSERLLRAVRVLPRGWRAEPAATATAGPEAHGHRSGVAALTA